MEKIIDELKTIKENFIMFMFDNEFIDNSFNFLNGINYYNNAIGHNNHSDKEEYNIFEYDSRLFYLKDIYSAVQNQQKLSDSEGSHRHQLNQSTHNVKLTKFSNKELIFMAELIKASEKKRIEEENFELKRKEILDQCIALSRRAKYNDVFDLLSNNKNLNIRDSYIQSENGKYLNYQEILFKEFKDLLESNEGFKEQKVKGNTILVKKSDTGIITKFQRTIRTNILNFLKLIYSVDYFKYWFPFMSESKCQSYVGLAQIINYMVNTLPLISDRDFLVYGYGINDFDVNRTIYVLSRSVEAFNEGSPEIDKVLKSCQNSKNVRGCVNLFGFKIKLHENYQDIVVDAVVSLNPKIDFVPQSLLNLVLEKMAIDLFAKILEALKDYENSKIYNRNPNSAQKLVFSLIEGEISKSLK